LEAITTTITTRGCSRSPSTHQGDQIGDPGERRGGLANRLVDLAAHPREAQFAEGNRRQTVPGGEQLLDVEAIAGVGRHPPGRGVRVGEEASILERGELRAHGRRAPADLGAIGNRLGADRLATAHVGVNHRPEHGPLSLTKHRLDCRFTKR
jgi:hypothetical protein